MLRAQTDPLSVVPAVRHVVRQLDPSAPLSNVATIDELAAESLEQPQSLSRLVGAFALVALVLSVVGIYGVMSYYVQQHLKDISIRVALGGSSSDIIRLVVGQGMKVVTGGVVVGCADGPCPDTLDDQPLVRCWRGRCVHLRCGEHSSF